MRLARKIKILLFVIILGLLLLGCNKKIVPKKYVAKVANTYLMPEDVNSALLKSGNSTKHREEYIRNWVETEMLYKEAVNQGITKGNNYKTILNKLKKELAAVMLVHKKSNYSYKIDKTKILKYFNSNKDDFKTLDDAVVVNYVKFNNEQKAIKFRNLLLNSNWESASSIFKNDSSVIDFSSNKYLNYYEISPPILLRYIKNLNPGEIGIVLKTSPKNFAVVQLKVFFKKGNVPKLEYINEIVKQRYLMIQRKKAVRNYINKLYSKYNVEIKKGN